MSDTLDETRRRFLYLTAAGATTGLAGCGGGGGGGEGEETTDGQGGTATEGGMETTTGGGTSTPDTVPAAYETATALGGTQRDPSALSSKSAVQYQSQPKNGQQCSGCQFYIPDKNGDGMGACAIVEGLIAPDGYCVSYAALETETGSGTSTTTDSGTSTATESE